MKFIKPFFIIIALTILFTSLYFMVNPPLSPQATKESVTIQIIGAGWSGSGFILKDGIIVTAGHILEGIENGQAVFSDGTIVYFDPNTYMIDEVWDIAITRISGYSGPYAVLGDVDSIIIEADVEIVGFPLGINLWHSFGEVARLEKGGDIDIDCDANPGNSGGPIFIGNYVVGVLTCGYSYTDISSGVAVNVIKNMVDRYEILKD